MAEPTEDDLRALAERVQREVEHYAWTDDLSFEWASAASPKAVVALLDRIDAHADEIAELRAELERFKPVERREKDPYRWEPPISPVITGAPLFLPEGMEMPELFYRLPLEDQ